MRPGGILSWLINDIIGICGSKTIEESEPSAWGLSDKSIPNGLSFVRIRTFDGLTKQAKVIF